MSAGLQGSLVFVSIGKTYPMQAYKIRRKTMTTNSLIAPKRTRRRKMDAAVKAKVEKLFNP
jgi:hypothetical protein